MHFSDAPGCFISLRLLVNDRGAQIRTRRIDLDPVFD